MKTRVAGLWIATALLVFGIGSGGATELAHLGNNGEGIVHLGYPVYFVTIIGFSKVLGAVALPAPGFPTARRKQWAHAGISFIRPAQHRTCLRATRSGLWL